MDNEGRLHTKKVRKRSSVNPAFLITSNGNPWVLDAWPVVLLANGGILAGSPSQLTVVAVGDAVSAANRHVLVAAEVRAVV